MQNRRFAELWLISNVEKEEIESGKPGHKTNEIGGEREREGKETKTSRDEQQEQYGEQDHGSRESVAVSTGES